MEDVSKRSNAYLILLIAKSVACSADNPCLNQIMVMLCHKRALHWEIEKRLLSGVSQKQIKVHKFPSSYRAPGNNTRKCKKWFERHCNNILNLLRNPTHCQFITLEYFAKVSRYIFYLLIFLLTTATLFLRDTSNNMYLSVLFQIFPFA